ncbi:hypothetical protein [Streptomyces sp. NPDC002763]|uniref:hypothetical protein n=1 Tax=Streptomyces sp. NPDC002763 TaxID=3154427 RepID=UPI00331B73D7
MRIDIVAQAKKEMAAEDGYLAPQRHQTRLTYRVPCRHRCLSPAADATSPRQLQTHVQFGLANGRMAPRAAERSESFRGVPFKPRGYPALRTRTVKLSSWRGNDRW